MHKNGSTIKYTHPWVKDYFKEIRFHNRSIEKPKIKRLKNIDLSAELPFFERLSIIKTNQAFSEYAMSYKVEIVGRKVLIVQLEVSKLSIKNFFGYLLNDTKGFKHQITVKILLKRYKPNGEIEFAPVYFNSWTKTVINSRFKLEDFFQEILYMIDAWINEESGWNIESTESQYINISTYRPLSGSFYIDLPIELKHPRKGLINIKNKDQKCFLWCHVRHINPSKDHPRKIKEINKKIAEKLDYSGIKFLIKEKDFHKTEIKNNIYINVFSYKNGLIFQFIFLIKNLKIQWIYCFQLMMVN